MRITISAFSTRMARTDPQKLWRAADVLLAVPIMVLVSLVGVYVLFWRTAPLLRFAHMLWVLGLWMAGTVAMFACLISARLKTGGRIQLLFFAFPAIALALYSTPLSRFAILFKSQTGLILPAAAGGLMIIRSWLLVLCLRNSIA